MADIADRYRTVAADFTARAEAVPADAWDRPSPCAGWTARDVVQHLADSARNFLGRVGIELPADMPTAKDDPLGTWRATRDAVQAALDDAEVASREYDSPMGTSSLEKGIGFFGIGDVLVHTWDLCRATGQDVTLNPDEVHRLFSAMEPMDAMMRQGTAFGPKVTVPDDADEQTKLIAFTGRQP
jgi:uncharacterized protein (TIGR03086 family)